MSIERRNRISNWLIDKNSKNEWRHWYLRQDSRRISFYVTKTYRESKRKGTRAELLYERESVLILPKKPHWTWKLHNKRCLQSITIMRNNTVPILILNRFDCAPCRPLLWRRQCLIIITSYHPSYCGFIFRDFPLLPFTTNHRNLCANL